MRLGILGGGQLARMLALSAYPLGIRTLCIDPDPKACAGDVTELISAAFTDESALSQFLSEVDCVTFETENIPLSCAEFILKKHVFYPSIKSLAVAQDRLHEKSFFKLLQIPTPPFRGINTFEELTQAVSEMGVPAVLKTRQMGYDGKGQFVLKTELDVSKGWSSLQNQSLILEKYIDFECEVSLIAVRNKQAEVYFYPLILNHHEKGILRTSEVPFNKPELQQEAQKHALKILDKLQYIGVLTIEYFYDGKQLIANEMAPRVHNSGHWTIEGAYTSQFENHLRAIYDLPLGRTETLGHCFLLNCISEMISAKSCLQIPGTHYHSYGKTPRLNRKLGHVTLVDTHLDRYLESKQALSKLASKD